MKLTCANTALSRVKIMGAARLDIGVIVASLLVSLASARADTTDLGPVLDKVREKFHAPGVAAAVSKDGNILAVGASGVRDLDRKDPVAKTDRSLIGSCGKAATRLLIGRLVEKGKLKWESTLGELLPDVRMRDEYKSVTLGDVIGHRGGIRAYTMISPKATPILFEQNGSPREQRAAFIAHLLSEPPAARPKAQFVYSNAGYGLLGHIAERAMEKPYEQLMRDEVFRPLGMTSAIIGAPGEAGSAPGWTGHERTPQGFQTVKRARGILPPIAPAGGMSMSIEDFAKLAAAMVNVEAGKPTDFLGKAAIERLPELRPGAKGVEGEVFFGGDGQFTAAFALWPSRGLGIVVETNAGESDDVCQALVDAVRSAVAPEVSGGDSPALGGTKPKRYGFQIKAEGDDDHLLVGPVNDGSPAAAAGLKPGDRILSINGTPLSKLPVDDRLPILKQSPLTLRVEREGKEIDISMKLP